MMPRIFPVEQGDRRLAGVGRQVGVPHRHLQRGVAEQLLDLEQRRAADWNEDEEYVTAVAALREGSLSTPP